MNISITSYAICTSRSLHDQDQVDFNKFNVQVHNQSIIYDLQNAEK
jgi:hypothetical protein